MLEKPAVLIENLSRLYVLNSFYIANRVHQNALAIQTTITEHYRPHQG